MRDKNKVFHLAIPCKSLDETVDFYEKLGCQLARRYDDRVTFNFFGDQVVCHLNPDKIDTKPKMYPRHFGITFTKKEEFDQCLTLAEERCLPFFQEPMMRFEGRQEEHETFFLIDPSNNLLEFKYYQDTSMVY
ncbi:VOC family protein [Evansella cellulosilytica]|uniref:Glyoxalase/bleomycin resistance protein/dioxygenase n=1 Tax=Evansella cellulosilytica (strain ATCC 21833 / DSM 2522 / FERM P-1141 / JCM 9156 / N-4) TaxID=649639 RepID=E6TZS2_EVAC2|nr:VOC family protein [Evansella cellulosilytica]ADU31378.1 Glyoxalase/bleomycin resistance protein/dioxygenase [Evansella cellulosilytica DSM 2522]